MREHKTHNLNTAKFLSCVMESIPRMTFEDMRSWARHPKALKGALSCLATPEEDPLPPPVYHFFVDYLLTLEQMIKLGKYDWVNSDIIENFKILYKNQAELSVENVHFDLEISSENAILEMAKIGLHPATLEVLLAVGAMYPEVQRQFASVALGSSCKLGADLYVPFLDEGDCGRNLGLHYSGGEWDSGSRFLAVHN